MGQDQPFGGPNGTLRVEPTVREARTDGAGGKQARYGLLGCYETSHSKTTGLHARTINRSMQAGQLHNGIADASTSAVEVSTNTILQ